MKRILLSLAMLMFSMVGASAQYVYFEELTDTQRCYRQGRVQQCCTQVDIQTGVNIETVWQCPARWRSLRSRLDIQVQPVTKVILVNRERSRTIVNSPAQRDRPDRVESPRGGRVDVERTGPSQPVDANPDRPRRDRGGGDAVAPAPRVLPPAADGRGQAPAASGAQGAPADASGNRAGSSGAGRGGNAGGASGSGGGSGNAGQGGGGGGAAR